MERRSRPLGRNSHGLLFPQAVLRQPNSLNPRATGAANFAVNRGVKSGREAAPA